MALVHLVRHGETEWNVTGRLSGRTDISLSEAGRGQTQLIAHRLKPLSFAAIYSSPLRRALETSTIIGRQLELAPIVDERLAEMGYGLWEGRTFQDIIEKDSALFARWNKDPGSLSPPNGESGVQAMQRVIPFLDFVASNHARENIVVVSHRTMCRLIICYVLGLPASEFRRRIGQENAAINIIQPLQTGWRLVLLNDISHLSRHHPERSLPHEDF